MKAFNELVHQTWLCVKGKEITEMDGSGHHPQPGSAEIDIPYLGVYFTLHTVSLTKI